MSVVKALTLYNFRNYKNQKVEFSPKLNLLVGRNGQGKTNILEALGLFISGRSFRSRQLTDCIRKGEKSFHIELTFESNGVEQTMSLEYSSAKKVFSHNATPYSSFLPLVGIVKGVLFAGFFDEFIKGSPQVRRRFLDLQSSQVDPVYLNHLKAYYKALKERNFLLKNNRLNSISIYEELMANAIPYLVQSRRDTLAKLEGHAQQFHQEITQLQEPINLIYKTTFIDQKEVLTSPQCQQRLEEARSKDLSYGHSTVGPHKDDLDILLSDKTAKKYASEGQIQTIMTSLYLAELKRLSNHQSQSPIFCFDDFGQNMDQHRQTNLLQKLEQSGQVFITTPEIPPYTFQADAQVNEVKNGQVYAATATG